MATKAKLREEAAHRLEGALRYPEHKHARTVAALTALQEKLKAGELSDSVVKTISTQMFSDTEFDKVGNWGGKSSLDGYRAKRAKREKDEAPAFALLLETLNNSFAAGGMEDVENAMHTLVTKQQKHIWDFRQDLKVRALVIRFANEDKEAVAHAAAKKAQRAGFSEEYVAGVYALDAILNAPHKKLATPVKMPGKPTKAEADEYNAAVATAPKKRAKKAAA